jgi:hypothetical protein
MATAAANATNTSALIGGGCWMGLCGEQNMWTDVENNQLSCPHASQQGIQGVFCGPQGGGETTLAAAVYASVHKYAPHLLAGSLGPVEAVFTFGSPSVAQPSFAHFYEDELGLKYNTLRWVYGFEVREKAKSRVINHDHVPDLPGLHPCGYVHVGQLLWVEAHISSTSPSNDWKQRHTCSAQGAADRHTHFYVEALKNVDHPLQLEKNSICQRLADTKWAFIGKAFFAGVHDLNFSALKDILSEWWNGGVRYEMIMGHGSYVAGLYDCLFQEPTYNGDYASECVNAIKFHPWVYGVEPVECKQICGTEGQDCLCTRIPSALAGQQACACHFPQRRKLVG